jgi:16S rRNA (guanine966-N2)-methyltransferase
VLDLYAGSGALGIEALSRGAEWCDFVERVPDTCAVIRENLQLTGFSDRAAVHCIPAERAVGRLAGPYTLILADPPYKDVSAPSVIAEMVSSELVDPGRTVLVLEHGARTEPAAAFGPVALLSSRCHGDSAVSIYR